MRVLITGGSGTLGRELRRVYGGHEVWAPAHADLDVTAEPQVWAAVAGFRPDLVVHAAAWTDVDGCEQDPDRAHVENAIASWWVARACAAAGSAMVLVSTDHVFGAAETSRPLTEFDTVAPANAYGASKAAAEELVRRTLDRHYVVRSAWIVGRHGEGFVRAIADAAERDGRVAVVDDQVGSPTFAPDLADAIHEVSSTGRYGTYHRTNAGSCSRAELARAALEVLGIEADVVPVRTETVPRPAPRPAYAVLSDRHSVGSGLRPLPHWRDALTRLAPQKPGSSPGDPPGAVP